MISAFMIFLQPRHESGATGRSSPIPGFVRLQAIEDQITDPAFLKVWRMGRDSNPRYLAVHTLSRRAQSTALAPIQDKVQTFLRPESSFNLFSKPNFNPERSFGNPVRTERLRRIEGLGER